MLESSHVIHPSSDKDTSEKSPQVGNPFGGGFSTIGVPFNLSPTWNKIMLHGFN